jgi:phage-related minor tail protein
MEIGASIEKSIVGNLTDAVMGTQSLGQAAVNVLNTLKRKLIEVQIEKAVAGIGEKGLGSAIGGFFKGIFGRERGGPVAAGGAYLVGEKGPEILQMGSRGGNIIPNNEIRGGGTTNVITVNVDAKGSSVAGNGSGADALGQLIAGIVQQTLVKEQRPGGLLNR